MAKQAKICIVNLHKEQQQRRIEFLQMHSTEAWKLLYPGKVTDAKSIMIASKVSLITIQAAGAIPIQTVDYLKYLICVTMLA
jgi:hypothetical protein